MNVNPVRISITTMFLVLWATFSYAAPLPSNRTLSIQLSAVDYSGQITPVDSTTAQTDAQGKFTFSFPTVPSIDRAQYLYLQVFDGTNLLRQSLVSAPDNYGTADAGISEVGDLQTRILMNSRTGAITPFRMVAALTMLRTTALTVNDADKIGTAIGATSDAFYSALSAGGATGDQIAAFNRELLAGLRRSMSLYRKSVDDSIAADITVEARGRSAAMALLIKEIVAASAAVGISLDITEWAFMSAASAAETTLVQQGANPTVVSIVRLCFVNGMILHQTARVVRSQLDALATLKMTPPTLQRYFDLLALLSEKIPLTQPIDTTLMQPTLADTQSYETQIFNLYAIRDVAYGKYMMQALTAGTNFDAFPLVDPELENLLDIVIGRMAATNGVMAGMTKSSLQTIMGSGTNSPISLTKMSIWLYLQQVPQYAYSPIVGLSSGLGSLPPPAQFNQLTGAYKAQALMDYDMALSLERYWQDENAAQNGLYTWYSFATAANLKKFAITRRTNVLASMSGIATKEADAIVTISRGFGNNFY